MRPNLTVSGRIMEFFQCGTVKCVTTFCHFSKCGAFQKWQKRDATGNVHPAEAMCACEMCRVFRSK
jgi:hypothetical protein